MVWLNNHTQYVATQLWLLFKATLIAQSYSYWHIFDRFSIHWGWLLLDRFSKPPWSIEIPLHAFHFSLFFTCFASFYYLVIHSILFHYILTFIWIPCAPLIIFMFLGWSFITSCTLCQLWQKGGKCGFFFRFYMLRG